MSRADKVDGARSQKPWSRPPSHSSRHPTPISGGGVARMDLDLVVVPCLSQRQTMPCIPLSAACARNERKGRGGRGRQRRKMGLMIWSQISRTKKTIGDCRREEPRVEMDRESRGWDDGIDGDGTNSRQNDTTAYRRMVPCHHHHHPAAATSYAPRTTTHICQGSKNG